MIARGALLVIAVAGCGSGPANLTSFVQAEHRVQCDAIFRCCDASIQALYGADVAACGTTLDGRVDTSFGEDAITKGKIVFDAGLAAQCLDAERAAVADCDAPMQPTAPDPCPQVATGQVQDQGDCDQRVNECAPGEFCLGTNPAPAPGECQQEGQVGDSCSDVPCADGVACTIDFVCITPLADGQPCQLSRECANANCAGMICAPVPTVRQVVCR
jgi:hypothetical protein